MPSTLARDLLRTFVLKTNGIWPLSICNRLPYSAAVRLFLHAVRDRPEIASVYLRHGMTGSQWTPGLSDIDWTVILESGLDDAAERDFLEWFWNTYDRLRRLFPMLGEVVILEERQFRFWQIYSSTTSQGWSWMLLHGRETASVVSLDPEVWRARSLNSALWMYLEHFMPCVSQPDSYLHQLDVARRARRISRYMEPVIPQSGGPSVDGFRDSTETVARVAKLLEIGVRALTGVSPSKAKGNGVRGVISLHARLIVTILEDDLETEVIQDLLRAHGEEARVPMPRCVFAYMMRHYDPYLYTNFVTRRKVLSGDDPAPDIEPPELEAFAAYTMDRIAYLLTMTGSESFFSTRERFSMPVLEGAVNRGLAVQMLLRENWVATDQSARTARLRSTFPDSYAALDEIREHLAAGRERDARRAAFHLFRPIAAGICELLNRV